MYPVGHFLSGHSRSVSCRTYRICVSRAEGSGRKVSPSRRKEGLQLHCLAASRTSSAFRRGFDAVVQPCNQNTLEARCTRISICLPIITVFMTTGEWRQYCNAPHLIARTHALIILSVTMRSLDMPFPAYTATGWAKTTLKLFVSCVSPRKKVVPRPTATWDCAISKAVAFLWTRRKL